MPGNSHEVLVATLREQPSLLGTLVHALTGRTLAPGLLPVDSVVRFIKGAEVRPDLLLAHGQRWTLVEVQNTPDPEKRRRWLLASGVLLDQTGALGDVIVITAKPAVARWARTVAHASTSLGTRLELTPVVLHVSPEMSARLLSEAHPELAVVATWAVSHRHGPEAQKVVERAIEVTGKLPTSLQKTQRNAILSLLSERMVAWLKETMMNPDKIPMSPAALAFKAAMHADGRAEGLAEGRTEGLAEGKREALLDFLRARKLPMTAAERTVIERCADPAELSRWIMKAGTAASVAEVLAPEKKARAKRARAQAPTGRARAAKPRATRA